MDSHQMKGVVSYIQHHLKQPLSLEQLANYAGYSPYHFTRIFKEQMGISPFYYISSLRMQQAKTLLLQTNFPVREIGLEIGQQSLGTFTTQFTKRIGVSPAEFRKSAQIVSDYFYSLQQLDNWESGQLPTPKTNQVAGMVESASPFDGIIFVGLFAKPVPEGPPIYGTLLSSIGEFYFTDVKPGRYYLMATSIPWEMAITDVMLPEKTLRFRSPQAIIVKDELIVPMQHVTLRPPMLDDPPILVSLPLLMETFLNRII